MTDPRLVDIEPGGESTQYESIRIYTEPPAKQTGQLGGKAAHTESKVGGSSDAANDSSASGDEYNMAQKLGMGISKESEEDLEFDTPGDAAAAKARRQQGYGPGSGVGA
ncbi:hypothetical protein N7532_000717 [Penicillium argentinense]|uniref:Uncharacterized protein n=1 Tax=Penicillium argentinense TaxID=1131581 RepID=A0A9W9G791_9EURO|nr:uncharacterized protein N7532_000717 [Penicillium argentinense]KAJ5112672.1 hypothetical protein N7532_000717 [Penicillium argentinense]